MNMMDKAATRIPPNITVKGAPRASPIKPAWTPPKSIRLQFIPYSAMTLPRNSEGTICCKAAIVEIMWSEVKNPVVNINTIPKVYEPVNSANKPKIAMDIPLKQHAAKMKEPDGKTVYLVAINNEAKTQPPPEQAKSTPWPSAPNEKISTANIGINKI